MRRVYAVAIAVVMLSACGGGTTTGSEPGSTAVASTTSTSAAVTTTIAAVTTTIAVPATTTTGITGTWFDGLAEGTCFDDAFDATGSFDFSVAADVVPCSDPHDNEIVAVVALGDGDYPAGDLGAALSEACGSKYEGFLGRPIAESLLASFEVFPDAADWAAGVNSGLCVVYAGEPVRGSVRSGALKAPGEILAVIHEADGATDVWTVDGATGELTANLSHDTLFAQRAPATWDGDTVLYAAGSNDVDRTIFAAVSGEANPFPVTGPFENAAAGSPAIRPGYPGQFAYIADPNGTEFDVYLFDSNTGMNTRLTTNPDRDTSPNWSPDGSKLAFRARVNDNSDVYLINADGTGLTRLTDEIAFDGDPRWSPDGSRILFTSDRSGDYEIWVMDADGSNQRNLSNHPADDEYPTWSSDGSLIAFHSDRQGGVSLWLMMADGSEQSLLSGEAPIGYPMFSPLGT